MKNQPKEYEVENGEADKETPKLKLPKMESPIKKYEPRILFPQRLQKKNSNEQFDKFLEVFKKLHIDIPFAGALAQM